jgi:nucleoid-associated protein EbfC
MARTVVIDMTQEQWTLGELAKHAQEMAQNLMATRDELAALEHTGTAGGGQVSVTMRGDGEVTKVAIDQQAVYDGDAQELSALVLSALRTAYAAMHDSAQARAADLSAASRFPTTGAS